MVPAPFVVVLDANVLFPFTLRDTLLRAAAAGFYQLRWSAEILDETATNLVRSGTMDATKANRLRAIMEREFPEAAVKDYAQLIPAMRNDEKDRHVAAAAVKAGAQVIVTSNLKDFENLPDGVEAQSPDEFLGNLLDLHPAGLVEVLREQAADLVNPPMSFDELLDRLARVVPEFVAVVRAHLGDDECS
jgi:predicted nucleic acid-binding protein